MPKTAKKKPNNMNQKANLIFPLIAASILGNETKSKSVKLQLLAALRSTSKSKGTSILNYADGKNILSTFVTGTKEIQPRIPAGIIVQALYDPRTYGVVRRGTRQSKPITIPQNARHAYAKYSGSTKFWNGFKNSNSVNSNKNNSKSVNSNRSLV